MKIAMIASEANPLAKTGGLADVVYSLSKELTILGEEVIIVMPFYRSIKENYKPSVKHVASYGIKMAWRTPMVEVYQTYIDGITYYLIDNEQYFARQKFYGEYDDGERFGFFTMAVKELFSHIKFKPDIIHVHDWQAAMLPCIVKERPIENSYIAGAKFVLTIHNPAFQGLYDKIVLGDFYNLTDDLYDNGKVRFKGMVSTLKSGIVYADKITTVSPTHRCELLNFETSMELEPVIKFRRDDFVGILNGIDVDEFNPSSDKKIAIEYGPTNFVSSKKKCKEELFSRLNIKSYDKPLFSMVSRLTWQKGMDLVIAGSYTLAGRGCNVVILGSGEKEVEQELEKLRSTFPNNVAIFIGYNDSLAHQIYSASDYFMMPSLFEPCGIGQMIAQRYGTLPIVRRTGGLNDTVIGYDGTNLATSNGFAFDFYSRDAFINTCLYALGVYDNKVAFRRLVKNALLTDNSWSKSAKEYQAVYKSAIGE
ncbi:MAG: glycogen synthase [Erysipelotrichaceae bacterium]|nr:glycogen synthase [Erysipelotrichaceae bacterium]